MLNDANKRAILDGNFEETENGVFIPTTRSLVQGVVVYNKRGEPEEVTHNLIVSQGLNYLLEAATGGTSAIGSWYVAVFTGDVTVQASWTAANFATNATEFTNYENANRPAWNASAVSGGARDSFANKAEFKSAENGVTLRGAALISSSSKGGASGILMGATRFTTSKGLDEDEILDVGYGLQVSAVV